jgi:hypothetical protein
LVEESPIDLVPTVISLVCIHILGTHQNHDLLTSGDLDNDLISTKPILINKTLDKQQYEWSYA